MVVYFYKCLVVCANIYGRLITFLSMWCIWISLFVYVPLHIVHVFAGCMCQTHQKTRKKQIAQDTIPLDPLSHENLCIVLRGTRPTLPEQSSPDSKDFNHYAELVTTSPPLSPPTPKGATHSCHANLIVHTDVSTHILELSYTPHHGLAIKVN